MQPRTKEKVIREAVIWIQYFVISSLSAVWAHEHYLEKLYGPPVEGVESRHIVSFWRDL